MLVSTDIFGVEQNRDTVENIRYFLSKLNIWQLTGKLQEIQMVPILFLRYSSVRHQIIIATKIQFMKTACC